MLCRLPTDRFDALVTLDVMVYVPRGDEGRVIGELARVVKPGGLLVLRTAALEVLRSHHAEFTGEIQRYTRSQIVRLASEAGIRVLRCTYANSVLMPVALAKFRLIEPLTGQRALERRGTGVAMARPAALRGSGQGSGLDRRGTRSAGRPVFAAYRGEKQR